MEGLLSTGPTPSSSGTASSYTPGIASFCTATFTATLGTANSYTTVSGKATPSTDTSCTATFTATPSIATSCTDTFTAGTSDSCTTIFMPVELLLVQLLILQPLPVQLILI